jgi:FdhD protein
MSRRTAIQVWTFERGVGRRRRDQLAGEEPLEVRLRADGQLRPAGVTMRTPGHDYELAAGLLYGEGLIAERRQIAQIAYCSDAAPDQRYNTVTIDLYGAMPHIPERHHSAGSACGVCGSASIAAIHRCVAPLGQGPRVTPALLCALPERLRAEQALFDTTGGLHAAALFDAEGRTLALREDIGRHNAVDKLIGWALLRGDLPLRDAILLVSGRAGFEIVQKAAAAGIAMLCSVSAPSSLAAALAREVGMTLVGFLRGERFNVYAGVERIQTD